MSDLIAGRTLAEWKEFARRDDCLDRMVPSDLRLILVALEDAPDARAAAHSAAMMKAWEAVYAAKTLSEAVDAIHQLAGVKP